MADFSRNHVNPGRESIFVYATAAKTGDTIPVWINGTVVVVKCARDIAPAANDVVLLSRTGMYWVVTARLNAAAVTPPAGGGVAPDPKPAVTTGTSNFGPVETRSYRSGGFTGWRTDNDDIYQGQYGGNGLHRGCAFYGNGPRSLAGVTVTSASIQVRRKNGGGITAPQPTTLYCIAESTRPGGAPTLQSSTTGPRLGWGSASPFGIPASFAAAIIAGTSGGLAIYDASGSPYVILDGKGSYGPSFTLTINWSR